jgi:hypothetical protein
MSGKFAVSGIKGVVGGGSVHMPDLQISLTVELPSGKKETLQVSHPHSDLGRGRVGMREASLQVLPLTRCSSLPPLRVLSSVVT